jgi:hypothetical protein
MNSFLLHLWNETAVLNCHIHNIDFITNQTFGEFVSLQWLTLVCSPNLVLEFKICFSLEEGMMSFDPTLVYLKCMLKLV